MVLRLWISGVFIPVLGELLHCGLRVSHLEVVEIADGFLRL